MKFLYKLYPPIEWLLQRLQGPYHEDGNSFGWHPPYHFTFQRARTNFVIRKNAFPQIIGWKLVRWEQPPVIDFFVCVFHVSVVPLTHWITFFFVNFHFCNCGSMSWAETEILCVFMMKRKKEAHLSHFFYSVTPLAAAVEPRRRRTLLLCDEPLLVLHVDWFLFEHSLDPNGWWGKLEFEWSALTTP